MYILAQVLAGLSIAILLGYTLVKVNRFVILVCNVIINLLLAAHYFLLDGYTGGACSLICAFMVAVFFFKGKIKWLSTLFTPIFFGVFFVVFGILTWKDGWSVIPIVGNLIVLTALWLDKEVLIKSLYAIVAALWIIYNLFGLAEISYLNVIGQSLALLFDIFYVSKYFIKKRIEEKKTNKIE